MVQLRTTEICRRLCLEGHDRTHQDSSPLVATRLAIDHLQSLVLYQYNQQHMDTS